MKARRRVLDAHDSTPTIRTNLPCRERPVPGVDASHQQRVPCSRFNPGSPATFPCTSKIVCAVCSGGPATVEIECRSPTHDGAAAMALNVLDYLDRSGHPIDIVEQFDEAPSTGSLLDQ